MPDLHFGNFHCEHEWADRGWSPPARLLRLNAELSATFVGVCSPGDEVWIDEPMEAGFVERLVDEGLPSVRVVGGVGRAEAGGRFVPWGWTDSARRFAQENGLSYGGPSVESVRRVNQRSFAFELEREFGGQPPGVRLLRGVAELSEAIAESRTVSNRWVLKAEFGMSARERVLGEGGRVDDSVLGWLNRRLERDGCVVFEPWFDVVEEAGVQWTVRPDGTVGLDGVVPLLSDGVGRYRGSRVAEGAEVAWGAVVASTRAVAERVASAGYHGPVGVDVCRFRAGGTVFERPVQDLNARGTMGRLALGFARFLGPGTWLHVRWPSESADEWCRDRVPKLPSGVRVVRTSPFVVGGRPAQHGSLYVAGDDDSAVAHVVEQFVDEESTGDAPPADR